MRFIAIPLALLAAGCAATGEDPSQPAGTQPTGAEAAPLVADAGPPPSVATTIAPRRSPLQEPLERVDTSRQMDFPGGMAVARSTIPSCHRVPSAQNECEPGRMRFACSPGGILPSRCNQLATDSNGDTAVCCTP